MNILVTGGSGFLGRFLIPFLESKGNNVISVNSHIADLTMENSLEKLNLPKIDQIFHLAAWTQAGDFCYKHPGEQWLINQKINTNVLSWWCEHQPQAKMIAFGTSVSYTTETDLSEDKYLDGVPSDKFYAYAMSKRMLLAGLQSLNKQFGLNYLYVIPSTLYGPKYHTDGRQLHFIYDLIRKIIRGKLYDEPVTLWGDGYQRRELVYVEDFVKILHSLNGKCANDTFNIGADEDHNIREFAQIICEYIDYDFNKIQYDINGYVGASSKYFNVQKLKNSLPNIERTSLKTGIEKTVEWLKTQDSILNG